MMFKKYVDRVRNRLAFRKNTQRGLRRRRSSILANIHSAGSRGITFDSHVSVHHPEIPEDIAEGVDRWHQSIALVVVLLKATKAFRSGLDDRRARLHTFSIDETGGSVANAPSTTDKGESKFVRWSVLSS
jgi:hypothetical protein